LTCLTVTDAAEKRGRPTIGGEKTTGEKDKGRRGGKKNEYLGRRGGCKWKAEVDDELGAARGGGAPDRRRKKIKAKKCASSGALCR